MRFAELLDAVDELPPEDQAELVEIVRRRLVERGREELAKEVQQARSDFHAGRCAPRTAEETLRDILS
jgi:predicted AAA+ superfamily ATPase